MNSSPVRISFHPLKSGGWRVKARFGGYTVSDHVYTLAECNQLRLELVGLAGLVQMPGRGITQQSVADAFDAAMQVAMQEAAS